MQVERHLFRKTINLKDTIVIAMLSQRHRIIPPIHRINQEIAPTAPDLLILAI
jgi:hypothetical protein